MFDSYTEIHWYEIFNLERRLVDFLGQASRNAHTSITWSAIQDLLRDDILIYKREDPVWPEFSLTEQGWMLAGQIREHLYKYGSLSSPPFLPKLENWKERALEAEHNLAESQSWKEMIEHRSKEYDAAVRFYDLLESEGPEHEDTRAAEQELDQIMAKVADNPAMYALLDRKRSIWDHFHQKIRELEIEIQVLRMLSK